MKLPFLAMAANAVSGLLEGTDSKFSNTAQKAIKTQKLNYSSNEIYDNGVALTPPMGWSSWNLFRNKINENLIYETALAMKNSGLADCGYVYVNLDDCWMSSMRDENGKLQSDFVTFPSGIKSLADKVNALGMKLGIYSSNGTLTCEDLPASLGKEAIDADTFAEWGIEYFKYDFGHNVPIPSKTPSFEKITVSKIGSGDALEFFATDAVLHGDAKVIDDSKLETGKCITGLSYNAGACEFPNVEVDSEGVYILTICYRKKTGGEKYCELTVNGNDVYKIEFPSTKTFTPDARLQLKINLKAGNNVLYFCNPVASKADSAAMQFSLMGKELKRATKEYAEKNGVPEKPIVYSICEWGANIPWKWGRSAGNLWRTTGDIMPVWASVVGIYEFNVLLSEYAGAGGWNDPDMLEVGNGKFTDEENKSHFSLWCMMAAPLILGNDIRKFIKADGSVDTENETYKILTNKDMIAVDQDSLGIQCKRIRTNGAEDILVKPLENDEVALCFFNKAGTETKMSCRMNDIVCSTFVATPIADLYQVRDLWTGAEFYVSENIEADVPAHGVKVYRIKVKQDD